MFFLYFKIFIDTLLTTAFPHIKLVPTETLRKRKQSMIKIQKIQRRREKIKEMGGEWISRKEWGGVQKL